VNAAFSGVVQKHARPIALMSQAKMTLLCHDHGRRIHSVCGSPTLAFDTSFFLVGKFDQESPAAGGATVAAPILNRRRLNAERLQTQKLLLAARYLRL
jgi:hypothetical protein